jgi:hypothetical protein
MKNRTFGTHQKCKQKADLNPTPRGWAGGEDPYSVEVETCKCRQMQKSLLGS